MSTPVTSSPTQDHLLVVEGPISDDGEMEYDIIHPTTCATYPTHWGGIGHECQIGMDQEAVGTMEAVGVERHWKTGNVAHHAAGTYRIEAWTETHDVPGNPIEYNSGIQFMDDEPAPGPVQHVPPTLFVGPVTFELVPNTPAIPDTTATESTESTSC